MPFAVRLRPIVLTSVTTMLVGILAFLSDPVWSGLAWSLLCGMLTSSVLTLVVIPIIYYGSNKVKYSLRVNTSEKEQKQPILN